MAEKMTDPSAPVDAYSLLSRPVLTLTDAEVEIIVTDLRKRRDAFVTSGTKDQPKKATAAKVTPTATSKAAATADLLAGLGLKLGGKEI